MAATAFDSSEYRRTVLTPLRSAVPASVDDLFWLGHVPRDLDDDAQIAACLKATKSFLHKEKSRPRQADVAAAVLREWPRVQGVLGDPAARASLRTRLGDAAPGAEVVGAGSAGGGPAAGAGGLDPAARRRRQVGTALGELARLRDEPELAEDLFAFLGLPVTATREMLRGRVEKVGEINRKRRPDRERSLVDELLMHSRELLVDGDPADYRAGLVADALPPEHGAPGAGEAAAAAPTPAPTPTPTPTPTVDPPASSVAGGGKIDYSRRRPKRSGSSAPEPDGTPLPTPDAAASPVGPPPPAPGKIDYRRRPKS